MGIVLPAKLGLSPQNIRTDVMPLMSYFGFVEEGGDVDVKELCALVKTVQTAKTPAKSAGKDAALERLRTLLVKAKDQGLT